MGSHTNGSFKYVRWEVLETLEGVTTNQGFYIETLTPINIAWSHMSEKNVELTTYEKAELKCLSGQMMGGLLYKQDQI